MKKVSPSFRNGLAHFVVSLTMFAMSSVALAQSGSSSVRGIVNDLQGRAVAGANVSLINEQRISIAPKPPTIAVHMYSPLFRPVLIALKLKMPDSRRLRLSTYRHSLTHRQTRTSSSLDDASGLQNAGNFNQSSLIYNPLNPEWNYANSDFDIRHNITANWFIGLPFGRGRKFHNDAGSAGKWNSGWMGSHWNLSVELWASSRSSFRIPTMGDTLAVFIRDGSG